ncbi:SUKH-3 domain-containing protein [Streptomyces alkaliterrae]|uniref:SUKH-3 domain-containing protein n=1 Tax=Streptomyces alkaliterrae TaxID=2213162 RepID=A0A5P0YZM1_9ACTN|nr:SUKH-3 domain-containing protein [Streptomyces alkaliterrae]MBB1257082.1 SUKH-3 domain-containing protein [Streptomyces alkaliterrae]MBB1257281.1 SUKH-3 domain-containing protein [Streptomyces alkaliterrae]MQS05172.1 SUKH-3 domain containing protein [Streptomyces alkaliterrae]
MTTRFPVAVDAALRAAGWQPGRWDIRQAEIWADTLRAHTSPSGHRHHVFPAAVEAWAEFGGLTVNGTGPGRHVAPTPAVIDPARGLHWARTLTDLGRALDTQLSPLGEEHHTAAGADEGTALLAIDAQGRVYSLDHSGDYYLGPHLDAALGTLVEGVRPIRLSYGQAAGVTPDGRPE